MRSFEVYLLPELIVLPASEPAPSYWYISFRCNALPTFPNHPGSEYGNPVTRYNYSAHNNWVSNSYWTCCWIPSRTANNPAAYTMESYTSTSVFYSESNFRGIVPIGTFQIVGYHYMGPSDYRVEEWTDWYNPFITYVETNATKVMSGAFEWCTNLSTARLISCSTMEGNVFTGCPSLRVLELGYSSGVCYAQRQTFESECLPSLSILVPSLLVSEYKSHSCWSSLSSRIFPIPSY